MKNYNFIFAAFAAIAALSGCAKEITPEHNPSSEGYHITFTAKRAETDVLVRAVISPDSSADINWSEGDAISVFDGDGVNCKFILTEGAGKTRGRFEGEVTKPTDSYTVLYPYQPDAKIDVASGRLSGVSLGSEQTAVSGSFDPAAGLMAAKSTAGNVIEFKNAVGYVKFVCGFDCKSVSISSTDKAVALAGNADIVFEGSEPATASVANPRSEVRLEGKIEKGKTYYIALLPGTMAKGFSLIFKGTDWTQYARTTNSSFTVKRNVMTNLGTTGEKDVELHTPYITFSADAAQTFKFNKGSGVSIDAGLFEYSVNGGAWTKMTAGTPISFGGADGDLRLRGKSPNGTSDGDGRYFFAYTVSFGSTAVKVRCTGDIRTLVDYENYSAADTKNARFSFLFDEASALVSAPDLPATDLADYCYYYMFNKTSIERAPELPATKLSNRCYSFMLRACENLTEGPKLPATELAEDCYTRMFEWCTSLVNAPELPAKTLAESCYASMFESCSGLVNAPKELPGEILESECYYQMFSNCQSLVKAPRILATGMRIEAINGARVPNAHCYCMFQNCTSLKTTTDEPIVLSPSDLADACYYSMFRSALGVKHIVIKAKTFMGAAITKDNIYGENNCFREWLYGAEAGGVISGYSELLNCLSSGTSGIPSGWTTTTLAE